MTTCAFLPVQLTHNLLFRVASVLAHLALAMASTVPGAERPYPIERLSSGALLRLDRNGDLVRYPDLRAKMSADATVAAGLDPRVGPNVLLGQDPTPLPPTMRAQAEPHIARAPTNPDLLVATFQEGRYAGPGAVDCGYALSRDGGLTWERALIPKITTVDGGPYYRATDPVAGIDLRTNIFLNTLGALDSQFNGSALLISRSTNGGLSFDPPIEIARSSSGGILIDKNWMAINTHPGTPTTGRIACTFTRFDVYGTPIALTFSDNQGLTWSDWKYITPVPYDAQGSQPVFLPGGQLAVVYWNFAWQPPNYQQHAIEVVVSADGGNAFGFSNQVAKVSQYSAPGIRDGSFLPAATGNRTDNTLYVTYQALYAGQPRILFTSSPNAGTNWTTPVPISDNQARVPVFNPAIAVSADGRTVTVVFYDGRVNPANTNLVDIFLAQSFDRGVTWQPNIRLTSVSSDVSRAPLTGDGYMLGDYQGIVPAEPPSLPAVAVYVDTRAGGPDPFVTRVGVEPLLSFTSWRAARLSLAQINSFDYGRPQADPDHDSIPNALEYAFGLSPLMPDRPALVFSTITSGSATNRQLVAGYDRLANASDLKLQWFFSTNLIDWTLASGIIETVLTNANPQLTTVSNVLAPALGPSQFFRLGATTQ